MARGGHGVISVTANIAAPDMATMFQLALKGELDEAKAIDAKLMPLHKHLFVESNPIPVKWAAQKLGLIQHGTLRLPLTPLSKEAEPVVLQALKDAKLLPSLATA